MSNFSTVLRNMMQTKQPPVSGSHIAKATGLSTGHISRIVRGRQTYISPEHFLEIVKAVTSNPQEQTELLVARCMDSLKKPDGTDLPGAKQIQIKLSNHEGLLREVSTAHHIQHSQEFERALLYLRQLVINKHEAELCFIYQMKLMGMPVQ